MIRTTKNTHLCAEEKYLKNDYKISIKDSDYTDAECRILWDFYVSRSFSSISGLSINLPDYGWTTTNSKTDGYPALENQLAEAAGIDSFIIIRSKTIKDTLNKMGLSQDRICITHPRAVLMQNFRIEIDENESMKIVSEENRIHALFRHIRNSLAHGNTYFFPNGMCLLEDKDNKKITAEILVSQETLLQWIRIVDKEKKYYSF